ncbi:FHA domain-containing protein [Butyrivibrio hungatei DSM 14810]|uniref:FHA domain-containing protein n=1 Tax=Butyrivibrio hungatei DSM 14810 TaxID=1121132 RepID=A0A1M7RRT8_9FIRM|nr:trypsin-like peptidase domain-containing protein [Butyrivibrio hungatei]SHN49005.1 FHA domain-containing protein [Butyrivibrio hungatei DSM 14810]
MNKVVKRLAALFAVCMSIMFSNVAYAQEPATEETSLDSVVIEDINSARNGVVQVNYVYIDDDDKTHIVKGGTGFIIGDAEKTEYVLTCESNITVDGDTKKEAFKYLGIPKEKNGDYKDVKLEVQVVAASDVTVEARVIATSSELDLAVLELSQPIHTRAPLSIYTSEDGSVKDLPYEIADKVYALGFPDEVIFETNEKYYSNDRIAMTTGSIANIATIDDVLLIQHDATVGKNNCGGPLINEDGKVIGMNVIRKDGDYFCALDSTEIIDVLDAIGVEYTKSFYEEEVVALASTEASSTGEEVVVPVKEKSPMPLIIVVTVICVLLLGVVIYLFVSMKKDEPKKKERKKKGLEPEIKPFNPENIQKTTGNMGKAQDQGTSLLDSNKDSGTTVLGAAPLPKKVVSGTLIRKRDKKQELIDKENFTIGKDSLHTDFCINDNSAISRTHAVIRVMQDGVYIEDCGSTNGTFVDDKRAIAGQPVKLSDGAIIKLADEEFEYRI